MPWNAVNGGNDAIAVSVSVSVTVTVTVTLWVEYQLHISGAGSTWINGH